MKRSIRNKKFILCLVLALCVSVTSFTGTVFAQVAWPQPNQDAQSEGAILMDANSGTVIYGKNIHEPFYPASITKILTALIVIENCDLDETLTFSKRAIFDVEVGSSNAGYDVGDTVTVRTALYAMLLQSANEAANALAEHVGGSFEGFCALMNMRAKELGCKDSHFANPSGLNNENHYTSAYDFALICKEAFANETFLQIDGSDSYTLPASKRNPEPYTVYAHHSMIKKGSEHYEGILGGKTGYTSLAGNTLVTCAERDGLKLITVILNGHQTHYDDTRMLLDFGFENYSSINLSEHDGKYKNLYSNLDIAGQGVEGSDILALDPEGCITLPKGAAIDDAEATISYELDESAPENAVAKISYVYDSRNVGSTYLERDFSRTITEVSITKMAAEAANDKDSAPVKYIKRAPLWEKIALGVLAVAVICAIVLLIIQIIQNKKRREKYMANKNKRKKNKDIYNL